MSFDLMEFDEYDYEDNEDDSIDLVPMGSFMDSESITFDTHIDEITGLESGSIVFHDDENIHSTFIKG